MRAAPPAAGAPPGGPRSRILGIDVARALAIVGMLAVHLGPTDQADPFGRLYALPHGRASVLFVLVAGIGVSLLAASRRRSVGHARRELAWRALLLLLAGLGLQELDHRVLVILQTYALLFLVGALALTWSDRALLAAAAAMALVGPSIFLAGVTRAPATFDRAAVRFADGPGGMAHGLAFSGAYPLVVWVVPFLLGMWLGRRDLDAARTRAALVGGGAVVAVLAWWIPRVVAGTDGLEGWARLLDPSPHSQMPGWLLTACGSATFVLGLSLLGARAWPRGAWPLAATGQLALTVYVGHLLALHAWSEVLRSNGAVRAAGVVLALTVVAAIASTVWRRWLPRGPLEVLLRWPPPARRE